MQVEQEQGFMEEAALGFGLRRGTIVISLRPPALDKAVAT
jgi:hypothetical protein